MRAAARRASSFSQNVDCSFQSRMVPSFVLTEQATMYAAGGVQQEKLRALCEQCQGELCWPCKAGYHQRASVCPSSARGRSSSAPREVWTEHEHQRIEPHRCCSLRAGAHRCTCHTAIYIACTLHVIDTDLKPCCVCKDSVHVSAGGAVRSRCCQIWAHFRSNPLSPVTSVVHINTDQLSPQ